MTLKHVTPTDLRQNLYQYLQSVNADSPIAIQGRRSNQLAVLMSVEDYHKLKRRSLNIEATPNDILYQKLAMMDEINDNRVFYSIGESSIMMSYTQYNPKEDPIWQLTNKSLLCLSCYILRANGENLTAPNLKQLAKNSFSDLCKLAKTFTPKTEPAKSLYTDIVNECIHRIESFALSDKTQNELMKIYRMVL